MNSLEEELKRTEEETKFLKEIEPSDKKAFVTKEKESDWIQEIFETVHGVRKDVGENRRMQIEYEHEQKIEQMRLENQAHKRNVIFACVALVILGAVIGTALVFEQGEIAKDFLYIILTAVGGAGIVQFFGKK